MKKRNGTRSPRRILAFAAVGGVTVAALIGIAVLLWRAASSTGAEAPDLPVFVLDRPEPVRVAYAYAIAHPEVLTRIPCYCGCVNLGHHSMVGGAVHNITDNPANDDGAAWSPDGTRVAFASDRNGHSRVYVSWVAGAD